MRCAKILFYFSSLCIMYYPSILIRNDIVHMGLVILQFSQEYHRRELPRIPIFSCSDSRRKNAPTEQMGRLYAQVAGSGTLFYVARASAEIVFLRRCRLAQRPRAKRPRADSLKSICGSQIPPTLRIPRVFYTVEYTGCRTRIAYFPPYHKYITS